VRPAAALAAALAAGLGATAWTAFTLAELGWFTAAVPLLAFPCAALPVYLRLARPRGAGGGGPAFAPQELLAAAIACATLLLSLPADEYILGGIDPGVYVHTAAAVARKGSLAVSEPDLAALTAEEHELVARHQVGQTDPFPGMRLLPDGRLMPMFYHLYPSLMGVAWALGGLKAALLVNPLLGAGAVLAVYALATALLGPWWGLAAACVHALSPAQIWQAKFPTAEMLTQLLLVSGAALLAAATRDEARPRLLAVLAGALTGLAALARYDTILYLVPFAAVLAWSLGRPGSGSRPAALALGTAGLFAAHAWIHQRFLAIHYRPLGPMVGRALVASAVAYAALLLVRRTAPWRAVAAAVAGREGHLRAAAAALPALWVLFGWFVRPRLGGQGRVGHLFSLLAGNPPASPLARFLSGVASRDQLFLVHVLGPAGICVALAGIAALVLGRRRLWESAWLSASCFVLLVFSVDIFNDRFLMWASRRYIPVVIPLASIAIAAAGAWLAGRRWLRGPLLPAAGALLVAGVVASGAGGALAMAREHEWPGLSAWYLSLEKAIPQGAVVYSDQPGFAAPLRFIWGKRSFELVKRSPERIGALLELMRRKAAGADVLYLSQQAFASPAQEGLVPLGSFPLRSSILAGGDKGVPTRTMYRGGDFVLYRVRAR
jgi:hypothetical protein